jgi:hypothetical protein
LTRYCYGYILKIKKKITKVVFLVINNLIIYKTMPRFNGTGPLGYGSGSGRGLGPCGAGMGWRRGGCVRGFGWRNFKGYFPGQTFTKKEEADVLSEEAEVLEEELKTIKSRLKDLKGKK